MSVDIECKGCGEVFQVREHRKDTAKWCSHECRRQRFTKVCEQCGEEFEVHKCRKDSAKYCSRSCSAKKDDPGVELTCDYCGEEFTRTAAKVNDTHNYCSSQCFGKDNSENVYVECSSCGASIERRPSELNESGNNYCSKECRPNVQESLSDPVEHECKKCGSQFSKIPELSESPNYCDNCAVRPSDVLLECEYCGDEFWAQSDSRKYCSRSCSGKSRTGEDAANWQGGKTFKYNCDHCGSSIEVKESNSHLDNHYCDEKCLAADRSKNVRVTCKHCKQPYLVSPHRVSRTKFCSNQCLWDWRSENYTGPSHPRWKEDSSKSAYYGRNWIEQREDALERDSHKCQRCGISSDSSIEKFGIDLHAHHITPLRKFDDKKEANRLQNLVSLCPSCHHIVEGTEDNGKAFQSKDDEQIPLPL